jgi:hypothetical protein
MFSLLYLAFLALQSTHHKAGQLDCHLLVLKEDQLYLKNEDEPSYTFL